MHILFSEKTTQLFNVELKFTTILWMCELIFEIYWNYYLGQPEYSNGWIGETNHALSTGPIRRGAARGCCRVWCWPLVVHARQIMAHNRSSRIVVSRAESADTYTHRIISGADELNSNNWTRICMVITHELVMVDWVDTHMLAVYHIMKHRSPEDRVY